MNDLKNIIDDKNKQWMVKHLKNIIFDKNKSEYILEDAWKFTDDGVFKMTKESVINPNKNDFIGRCQECWNYRYFDEYSGECTINNRLRGINKNKFLSYTSVQYCDAFDHINNLYIMRDEKDMIEYIGNIEPFFGCPKDLERYYGFERKYNEETGEILETIYEYYERGGEFKNIPDRYPCVVYFDYFFNGIVKLPYLNKEMNKENWIYIGE